MNYEAIDLCACYEPIEQPPQKVISAWKKYWDAHWKEMSKGVIPTFYATDEDGDLFFYHGSTRIRVIEHFADNGKSAAALIENVIQYAARQANY